MKKLILSISLILVLTGMGIQPMLAAKLIVIGLSKFKKEDREVRNFNGVASGGPIQVIITLGNIESLRFEGDADAIATLVTEVKGGILIIRPQNSWTSWAKKYDHKKITAYVSAKMLKSLTMSGNGSIAVNGNIKSSGFAATLSGSGSISAHVDANNFNGVISGSGNLNFSGSADEASITISGSGSFRKGFSVGTLTAVISGSGSVNLHAENNINAVISGSGSLTYSGNASVDKKVLGSGSVRKI